MCLSGLIDAGRIPENERIGNQPKKPKKPELLHEEICAYEQMVRSFGVLYSRGDVASVRAQVQQVRWVVVGGGWW
jgi:hypothetical protein